MYIDLKGEDTTPQVVFIIFVAVGATTSAHRTIAFPVAFAHFHTAPAIGLASGAPTQDAGSSISVFIPHSRTVFVAHTSHLS